MIAAALAALALAALPAGHSYSSAAGFTDAFGATLKDGRVYEVHVTGRDPEDGDLGPEDGRTTFSSQGFEYLFPSRSALTVTGRFKVDGRFRAHAGGMNRGIASWAFTRAK